MTRSSPTVKRRRIARELRRLRGESGTTATDVARVVGMSTSSLSRIEAADVAAHPAVVSALLRHYRLPEGDITALVDLAKQARRRGWWAPYNDVLPDWFEVYVGLESEAVRVWKYEPQLVPGLLQTADYARAIIAAAHPHAPAAEIDRRVELRLQRQERESPLALWIVLDEAGLRRVVGSPATMRAQLQRLTEVAQVPGNNVQILPFAAGEHGSMGLAFTILGFADPRDPDVVYLETRAGSLLLEETSEAESYNSLFDHLRASAAGVRESTAMISETIRSL